MVDSAPPVVLVPGYWLGAWAWDEVAAALRERGRRVVALTLPGLEPELDAAQRGAVTLADQVAAVVDALRAAPGAVLVGHSCAGPVVQLAADAAPELVSRLVWVDSGPAADGPREGADPGAAELPMPSFEQMLEEGESLEGLTEAQLAEFRRRAVPQPAATARDAVSTTGAWARVPATVVCTSVSAEQVRAWVAQGVPFVAGLARAQDVTWVDLPTSHWPMWSRPAELAAVLAGD